MLVSDSRRRGTGSSGFRFQVVFTVQSQPRKSLSIQDPVCREPSRSFLEDTAGISSIQDPVCREPSRSFLEDSAGISSIQDLVCREPSRSFEGHIPGSKAYLRYLWGGRVPPNVRLFYENQVSTGLD
jgi:hypothetical protein